MSVTSSFPFRAAPLALTACAGLGLLALASCGGRDSSTSSQTTSDTTTNSTVIAAQRRTLKQSPLERSWDLQLPHPALRSWISPSLPQLIFYQLQETHEVFAIDAMSGAPKWVTQPFPKASKVPASASHALISGSGDRAIYDDRAWVVSDDTLFSFDAAYGQVAWRFDMPFAPSTGPLGIGGYNNLRVFIGDWEGRIHVLTYDNDRSFPYELWQMNLRSPVVAPLLHSEGLVYAADQNGCVHCFGLDRQEVWQQETKAAIFGGLATRGRTLFVGNEDNKVYAFDRLNGTPRGTVFVNGPVRTAPFVFNSEPNRVYAFVDHPSDTIGGLVCITAQDDTIDVVQTTSNAPKKHHEVTRMQVAWRIPKVSRLVGSTPLHLFLTSGDPATSSTIVAVNRIFGRVDWTWDCSEEYAEASKGSPGIINTTVYQDPTDHNRSIFTADTNGRVIAYRMFGDKDTDPGQQVARKNTPTAPTTPAPAGTAVPASAAPTEK